MKDKKVVTYNSDQFDKKSLRASQKAVLKVAEKSINNGEYDTGVGLYSKLLSRGNIKNIYKAKIERNISDAMSRVQKTVQTAKQFVPPSFDMDQAVEKQVKQSNISTGIEDDKRTEPNRRASDDRREDESDGPDRRTGDDRREGESDKPDRKIGDESDSMPHRRSDDESIDMPSLDNEGGGQPAITLEIAAPPEGSPLSAPGVNLKDVDIQGVTLKNINLEGLVKAGSEGGGLSEELFSDAIDYTINKITDNVGKMVSAKPSGVERANFRGDKLKNIDEADDFISSVHDDDVQLDDSFFEKVDNLKSDMDSIKGDVHDLQSSSIDKISDTLFPQNIPIPDNKADFQDNLDRANEFFDKVNALAEKIGSKDIAQNLDNALSLFDNGDEHDQFEVEPMDQTELQMDDQFFDKIESISEDPSGDQIDQIINKEFDPDGIQGQLDGLDKRNTVLEKEMDGFKNLVDLFNSEKSKTEQVEKSLLGQTDSVDHQEVELSDQFFDNIESIDQGTQEDQIDKIVDKEIDFGEEHTDGLNKRNKALEEELDSFKNLVDMLNKEKKEKEALEKSLEQSKVDQSEVELSDQLFDNIESIDQDTNDDQIDKIIDKELDFGEEQNKLDNLIKEKESLKEELGGFKDLVDMLKEEKELRQESDESLEEFKKSLEEVKDELAESPPTEEEPDDFFQAKEEEVITKKVEKRVPKDNPDEMQHHPDLDASSDDDPFEKDFDSLDDLLDEDLSHVDTESADDFSRQEEKSKFQDGIDPTFMPSPYNTDVDFKNEDGFFQDMAGNPVIVPQPAGTSNEQNIDSQNIENQNIDSQNIGSQNIDHQNIGNQKEEENDKPKIELDKPEEKPPAPETKPDSSAQQISVQAELKEAKPPPPPPRRTMRNPIKLTYDFRSLFHNKYYWKYRDMLNHAATLVAEKKLDDALEYYYVIQDQNVPHTFKLMIQQNIKDIEETIANTFRQSDTIVKMDASGEVARVKVIEKEELVDHEYEYDANQQVVLTQEIAFRED